MPIAREEHILLPTFSHTQNQLTLLKRHKISFLVLPPALMHSHWLPTSLHVPYEHRVVHRGRCEEVSVRRPAQVQHIFLMAAAGRWQ